MNQADREHKAFVGTILLLVIFITALFLISGCSLIGDPIIDPVTGLVTKSPVATAIDSLRNSGSTLAPGVISDLTDDGSLDSGTKTAIGGAIIAALLAGAGAYRRRQTLKARRRV